MIGAGQNVAGGHRPEITGLRAVAVLPVILFHAGFSAFAGGYVGVDVFFVLSGFLITSIIVREHRSGSFTLAGFYERRARRILPALFLVVGLCIPFAIHWMRPGELVDFGESLIAVVVFVSNILFWRESGYFAGAAELKPLLHTWSLGIEEQYYLFFPLFVGLLLRFQKFWLPIAFAAVAVASFAVSLWLARLSPDANFYLIPSRAWELMAGSLLALAPTLRPRNSLALLGLALILGPVFLYDASTPFPGPAALPPVIGTVLVIAFADSRSLVGRGLSWGPMVWIGLVSYSAYLWHQPLFAFARLMSPNHPPAWLFLALGGLSLVLAGLSQRYVEAPFIAKPHRFTRLQVFGWSAIGSVLIGSAGLALVIGQGLPGRAPPEPVKSSIEGCPAIGGGVHACPLGARGAPSVVLLGDSHAYALADELDAALSRDGRSGVLLHTLCHPIPGLHDSRGPREGCEAANARMIEQATAPGVTDVIVAVRWTLRLADGDRGFDNGEGGVEADAPFRRNIGDKGQAVRDYFTALQSKRVTVLYPVPEAGWNPARLNMIAHARGEPLPDVSTSSERFRQRNAAALEILDSVPNVRRVRPDALLCDDRCVVQRDGVLYYADDDHLSREGARMVVRQLYPTFQSAPSE
ncbi:MAG: acyltransferase [Brevundimonas sp.]|uniref:acyltransferase family protein n=1 Tax=Brevundimonas sp. TaxID=1871086 RepID=UPI0017EBEF63|nr:acyltransferase family protein [Brevundimonas sp.]MBA4803154.1 acyltransferase [Brevundimonas sp.]